MQETLAARIERDLRECARRGAPPPSPLTLHALAGHYGVSPTPVRRAVDSLVRDGVLRRRPNGRLEAASVETSLADAPPPDTVADDWEARLTREVVLRGLRGETGYLREEAVAARHGVGRTVLRQAFHRLAGRGLLEHVPRCGWRVRAFDAADMDAYLAAREALELTALDLALPRLDPADLREMRDANAGVRVDNRLHAYLIERSGNAYVRDFFDRHGLYYAFLFDYAAPEVDFQSEAAAQHRAILDALLDGDGAAARAALSRHIRAQRPVMLRLLAALPHDRP